MNMRGVFEKSFVSLIVTSFGLPFTVLLALRSFVDLFGCDMSHPVTYVTLLQRYVLLERGKPASFAPGMMSSKSVLSSLSLACFAMAADAAAWTASHDMRFGCASSPPSTSFAKPSLPFPSGRG